MNATPLRVAVATLTLSLLGGGCVNTPAPPPARTVRAAASTRRASKPVSCVGIRESTRRQREVAQAAARRVYFSGHRSARQPRHHGGGSRYIAVKTESTTDSAGEATCMIFDRASGNLVNSLVYDCSRVPELGTTVKFASYNATYVGG